MNTKVKEHSPYTKQKGERDDWGFPGTGDKGPEA